MECMGWFPLSTVTCTQLPHTLWLAFKILFLPKFQKVFPWVRPFLSILNSNAAAVFSLFLALAAALGVCLQPGTLACGRWSSGKRLICTAKCVSRPHPHMPVFSLYPTPPFVLLSTPLLHSLNFALSLPVTHLFFSDDTSDTDFMMEKKKRKRKKETCGLKKTHTVCPGSLSLCLAFCLVFMEDSYLCVLVTHWGLAWLDSIGKALGVI